MYVSSGVVTPCPELAELRHRQFPRDIEAV